MSYTKNNKYETNYNEDLLLEYLSNQSKEYKLSDFLDVNEYDEDDIFNYC